MATHEQVSSRDAPQSGGSAIENVWDMMGSFVASFSPTASPSYAEAPVDVDQIPEFPQLQ